MPVHRADSGGHLFQGNLPRGIRRIVLAMLDPRKPRGKVSRQEQACKTRIVILRQPTQLSPLPFIDEGCVDDDRKALGEDTPRKVVHSTVDAC